MPTSEVPLFITDPADGVRKMVGTKQTAADGTVCWFRRITSQHVMRLGSFGLDATTFDTHFAGRAGTIRLAYNTITYETPIHTFEQHRTEKDHGHGRQYFLAFAHWSTGGQPEVNPAKPSEQTRLTFGEHVLCHRCSAGAKRASCTYCGGTGYTNRRNA